MTFAAFIAIGSNLHDPREQIRKACDALAVLPGCTLEAISSLYLSKPMGPPEQPDYLNAVARVATTLDAFELLAELQGIEHRQGRARLPARVQSATADENPDAVPRWGPRTLDLDLLLYGDRTIRSERLTVPHPGLPERDFVLRPLHELDAGLLVPGHGCVADLIAARPRYRLVEARLQPFA